ncbi:AbrB/MazE/SpoVT family DNA-binding domain-containing protein [Candidatus Electrothrix sp.]|uniref:AbrB/MazE/SpoVT family DNA-binding domain-containing protein n=1 Tax=Candidatus Electrothrix sp. TaxID=2170559 RepID=UPI004055B6A9
METTNISLRYKTVIQQWIRKTLQLIPRKNVQLVLHENGGELILPKSVREMRGFLNGINTDFQRDGDRV